MQVKEVMSKEIVTVRRSTTLKQLLETFSKFHIFPLVPVIDKNNLLGGIVSFHNLIRACRPEQQGLLLKTVPFLDEADEDIFNSDFTEDLGHLVVVEDIMETRFITIQEDAPLEEVYKLMKLHLKEEIPVVDKEGKLVGMVGIFDIIRYIFKQKGVI